MNNFCHLHLHSSRSVLDGLGKNKDTIEKAKNLKFKYIANTDHGCTDNLINWQKECIKQGIKPLLGVEAYITPDSNQKDPKVKNAHIIFLIKNEQGYITLNKLLTKAALEGFYRKPRVDFSDLLNNNLEGLVVTTACLNSWVNFPGGEDVLKKLNEKYPGDIYLEIMPHDLKEQYTYNEKILKLHKKYNISLIATNDVHYLNKEDWEAQEILLAIQSKKKWSDPKRFKFQTQGFHLTTRREMVFAFRKHNHIFTKEQIEESLNNTVEVAEKCCDFRIKKQEISLPMPYESELSDEEILKNKCEKWLNDNNANEEYRQRFEREFDLIKKKNFSRYFLIVEDVIQWSHKQGIEVGPGRGSSGGSLICLALGITKIDPIKYGLSFSRFLSQDRKDLPDIDVDWEKRFKSDVYEYLRKKYGTNSICGISTVMRMQSNAAFRDVCRVFDKDLGITQEEINEFAKCIDGDIQEAVNDNKICAKFENKYPKVIHFAKKMEGQCRGVGRHAAAVVISDEDLTQGSKCNLAKRKGDIVCNWDMENSEYSGLMKLDVLGLSTLTVLAECRKLINENHNIDFDFDKVPFDDKESYHLLSEGKTTGFFQMSTSALSKLCQKIKIDNFNDIVAAIALVRPGPWKAGMTDKYINRKHGEKWQKLHPIYEEITKDTWGVLCYQEQITEVIHRIAGLSKVVADKIRKIIAKKKDPALLEKYHNVFIEGCIKEKTLSKEESVNFWDDLMADASYSFNKAHSVAYAIVGYWTAYLKANYPVEFLCSSLSFAEWDEKSYDPFKRKSTLIEELKQQDIKIMPPKIGYSDPIKWTVKDGVCYVPFVEINGIGEKDAPKCCKNKKKSKGKIRGFFNKEEMPVQRKLTKIDTVLEELLAHDKNKMPSGKIIKQYLGFLI